MNARKNNVGASKQGRVHGRSSARLAAVQALYQMDMAGTDLSVVVEEFNTHRLGCEIDGDQYANADAVFFKDVLEGVVRSQRALDPMLSECLAEGWRLSRIDSILRAILRAGAYELEARADIPAKSVINEYVDVAHAFFAAEEPKAVNGILDKLARSLRPQELDAVRKNMPEAIKHA